MNETEQKQENQKISQWEAMGFVWELLLIVSIPTALAAYGGRWLDETYNITPWGSLLGLFLAFTICTALVLRRGREMAKRMKS